MFDAGVDTIVLGCTHYPFVQPLIEELAATYYGDDRVQIIDPAPAVVRQAARTLARYELLAGDRRPARQTFYTTGDAPRLSQAAQTLIGQPAGALPLVWGDDLD
jgi:glutamate racemase